MKTYKTFLPLFSGYYNSFFEPDETNEIDDINNIRTELNLHEINSDDCEFNYDEYFKTTSENITNAIESMLIDLNFDVKIKMEKLVSPKYYNFENDSINISIDLDKKQILRYLYKNIETFNDYIKNKYTSCSGFISSYSNDYLDWLEILNNENNDCEHEIGSILNFIIENEGIEEYDLFENVIANGEGVYLSAKNYEELTTK